MAINRHSKWITQSGREQRPDFLLLHSDTVSLCRLQK